MKNLVLFAVCFSLSAANLVYADQGASTATNIPQTVFEDSAHEVDGNSTGWIFSNFQVPQGFVAYIVHAAKYGGKPGYFDSWTGPTSSNWHWWNLKATYVDIRPKNYDEPFVVQDDAGLQLLPRSLFARYQRKES